MARQKMGWTLLAGVVMVGAGLLAASGCYSTPVDLSEYARGPAPLRMPSPAKEANCGYEDSLTGGKIFSMYCAYCHAARSLAERPFANSKNVMAHMRVRANLTGKEYAELMEYMRHWYDVSPANPPLEPAPTRLFFSQPLNELREQPPAKDVPAEKQPQKDTP